MSSLVLRLRGVHSPLFQKPLYVAIDTIAVTVAVTVADPLPFQPRYKHDTSTPCIDQSHLHRAFNIINNINNKKKKLLFRNIRQNSKHITMKHSFDESSVDVPPVVHDGDEGPNELLQPWDLEIFMMLVIVVVVVAVL